MTYRIRNIGLALGLAVIAVLLVTFYVNNYRKNVQQGEETVTVYVAARDIPAGTPGAEIVEGELLKTQEVEKRNVTPGAIAGPDQIEKLVAADPVYAGEQISARHFRTVQERGIRSQISGTLRAVAVPGDKHQILAGVLQAGDLVDVVATWNVPESAQNHYSRTILRDLLVLRAPTSSTAGTKITAPGSSSIAVVLALTDSQMQKLFWAMKNGEWHLELRPTDDPADSPQTAENAETLLLDGLTDEQLRAIIAAAQTFLAADERTIDEQP